MSAKRRQKQCRGDPKKPPRLKQRYDDTVKKATLKDQLGLTNVMQVPGSTKIVINMGVGQATQQPSLLEGAVNDLTTISGQKPIVTKATRLGRRVASSARASRSAARSPSTAIDVGVPRPAHHRGDPPHP